MNTFGGQIDDPYSNFIALSRYARWLEKEQRRETWGESVDRYVDFMVNHVEKTHKLDRALVEEIRAAIFSRNVMPSMRALMTAGPALARDHVAAYNCFVGDTKVVTKEYGSVSLSDISGEKVTALTSAGWQGAQAKYFGEQPTQRVTFKPFFDRTNHRVIVDATPDHRWILVDGTETTNLSVGDKVATKVAEPVHGVEYDNGVRHGIIFGDGSVNSRSINGNITHHVRLCGQHKDEMLSYFESYSYPPSYDGDAVAYWTAKANCKEFPVGQSDEYIAGFIYGWLLADGNQIRSESVKLDSQFPGAYEWLVDHAVYAGLVVTGIHYNNKPTNFGERKNPLARITLSPSKVMIVDSISELDSQDVYCLVVPETGDFVLSSGILTGNCSFIPVDSPRSFDEAMYILMCGTGVGFSVESEYVDLLPVINEHFEHTNTTIVVEDSKGGWARALREVLALLWQGQIPQWDVSKVRPAGAPLKTFGGRASGPEPLEDLFRFAIKIFQSAAGRKLKPIEAHDIMCKIGEVVVVGGVRRSAMISLSDLEDFDMSHSKSGSWWNTQPQRSLANNSAVYTEKPSIGQFMQEWRSLYESKSGERGIFNRSMAQRGAPRRDGSKIAGTNPCGEINLRAYEFCNLTEVVVRDTDTVDTLRRKVELATIMGTWQSTLTNFKYIRKIWRDNTEEERLLGVSLTGQFGNEILNGSRGLGELENALTSLKSTAISTNEEWAGLLGIQSSVAITTVKPSGTVSQLTGVSSGMHPWHSEYYVRTVRADNKDPLTVFLKDAGVYNEPDVMRPQNTTVFSFPKKAPKNAITRDDLTAIQHLEIWRAYKIHWTEHNPSITVNVREHEWLEVAAWVYENWEDVGGISFLPYDDHTYQQAPYQAVTAAEYEQWVEKTPKSIDWSALPFYETEDTTAGSQTLACSGDSCEIVDLVSGETMVQ